MAKPQIALKSKGRRRMPCVNAVNGIAATNAPTA